MVPVALTIAGSDSGGGAGIQADLKTFHQHGVYGTTVIVALTAQNTQRVTMVEPTSTAMVAAQLDALAQDLPPDAVKTGMLATAPLVRQVATAIERYAWRWYVLDPVMVATSGDRLLDRDAEAEILARLAPLATVITPNLEEASILTGTAVTDLPSMERAGAILVNQGARAALIKGGHLPGDQLVDVLVSGSGAKRFHHPRIATRSTHGTGCTLSAAITAGLARWATAVPGNEPPPLEAIVGAALDYLRRAIRAAPGLGRGNGPVSHWA
jgi:hydroxymethylpyrimidine/phosphomethylpyrimidine kinase